MIEASSRMHCEMGSIAEIHQRLVAEGFHVTQYALRSWIRTGQIEAIYSGRKAFVSYHAVLRFLRGTGGDRTA